MSPDGAWPWRRNDATDERPWMQLECRLSAGLDEPGTKLQRWNGAVQTVHQFLGKHDHPQWAGENVLSNAEPRRQHLGEGAAEFPSVPCQQLGVGRGSNRYPEDGAVAHHLH